MIVSASLSYEGVHNDTIQYQKHRHTFSFYRGGVTVLLVFYSDLCPFISTIANPLVPLHWPILVECDTTIGQWSGTNRLSNIPFSTLVDSCWTLPQNHCPSINNRGGVTVLLVFYSVIDSIVSASLSYGGVHNDAIQYQKHRHTFSFYESIQWI